MENIVSALEESTQYLSHLGFTGSHVGIVLGTGLGKLVKRMEVQQSIPYSSIPHFPVSTVEFHKGQLLLGTIGDNKVIAMQGRFHYYEGYTLQQVTFPVRVMHKLGIKFLLLSNAAGGINEKFQKGDLVLLDDHINLQPGNPLRGLNDPVFGNRFVDMYQPYDPHLNNLLELSATRKKIVLKSGVYAAVPGPNLETRAEYKYLQTIGADLVGMSTVPEVIVANHIGLKCAAVSVITDECHPGKVQPVNIGEIIRTAEEADEKLSALFVETLENINTGLIGNPEDLLKA